MKAVPWLISFTLIFYLKVFEFEKTFFAPFQIYVSLKKWLITKLPYSFWARPSTFSLGRPTIVECAHTPEPPSSLLYPTSSDRCLIGHRLSRPHALLAASPPPSRPPPPHGATELDRHPLSVSLLFSSTPCHPRSPSPLFSPM
jgi:hypothetical protein